MNTVEIVIAIGGSTLAGTITDDVADVRPSGVFFEVWESDDKAKKARLTDALATLYEIAMDRTLVAL